MLAGRLPFVSVYTVPYATPIVALAMAGHHNMGDRAASCAECGYS